MDDGIVEECEGDDAEYEDAAKHNAEYDTDSEYGITTDHGNRLTTRRWKVIKASLWARARTKIMHKRMTSRGHVCNKGVGSEMQ